MAPFYGWGSTSQGYREVLKKLKYFKFHMDSLNLILPKFDKLLLTQKNLKEKGVSFPL